MRLRHPCVGSSRGRYSGVNGRLVDLRQVEPDSAVASDIVLAYMFDIVSRWHGRPAAPFEVECALVEEPIDDLRPPHGCLVVAFEEDAPVGVGGLRFVDNGIAEMTKVFTVPGRRGGGIGAAVLHHLETVAREHGCSTVRLDTRSDLTEACRLYERSGFVRVEPFNDCRYSDRWYERELCTR
jgi:GNAT superfamily N-acetyltransferase